MPLDPGFVTEYRVLWQENIGGQVVKFSGKVSRDFLTVWREAEAKQTVPGYLEVRIQARAANEGAWLLP